MSKTTRQRIEQIMKEWRIKGAIVNHGTRDWQIVDCKGDYFIGFLAELRKQFPHPEWRITANPGIDERRHPR